MLALLCLAWLPFSQWGEAFGKARGVVDLFFTLIFVMSAVLLTAAWAMLPLPAPHPRRPWVALALLAVYVRKFFDAGLPLQLITSVVALAGAAVLLGLARRALARAELMASHPSPPPARRGSHDMKFARKAHAKRASS